MVAGQIGSDGAALGLPHIQFSQSATSLRATFDEQFDKLLRGLRIFYEEQGQR